jgi:prepilin-type N-terminal cleavage/methylation domain-containing protein
MRRGAFTLIEVMIVVLILSILLAIAVPSWIKARESSRRTTCLRNLKSIEEAKEIYIAEAKLNAGDSVEEGDLFPEYIKGDSFPACPESGDYTIGEVGEAVSCSIHKP